MDDDWLIAVNHEELVKEKSAGGKRIVQPTYSILVMKKE